MTSGTKAPPGLEAGLDSTGSAAPDTQTAPTPQGLGAALRNSHIARRFVILAYSWMVMCMVSGCLWYCRNVQQQPMVWG